ncbi:protein stum homolog [Tachypleus tridentatus]|uniref:protein stum homolog n=1 Tax=Tachypleus tridentatus TaxID=6853 RepID=UPI003FD225B3
MSNEVYRIPVLETNTDKRIVNQEHNASNYNAVKISEEHFKAMVEYYGGKPFIKYEIISVREKHSEFRKAVPLMPVSLSLLLCLVNVLAPGVGTLLAGMTIICGCKTEHKSRVKAILYNILASILQLVLAPVVIGWVWSIMWGITFVNISITKELQEPILVAPL